MKISITNKIPSNANCVVLVYENKEKSRIIKEYLGVKTFTEFKAELGEVFTSLNPDSHKKIILLGCGKPDKNDNITNAVRKVVFQSKRLSGRLVIDTQNCTDQILEQVVIGIQLGLYDLPSYKSEEQGETIQNISIVTNSKDAKEILESGTIIASAMCNAMDLVNQPSNIKTPYYIADRALSSSKEFGYKAKIWRGQEVQKAGFESLFAVGKGSVNPPAFVVMEYKSKIKDAKTIGIIGKGISFDTGGYSIKPSTNMHYMKSDMSGAAVTISMMEIAAQFEIPFNVIGIVPTAENAVDGNAYRPGDIIRTYGGKTIEVIDTDAEGRLVLADAISYMCKNYHTDHLIDLATLTGSCVATLGYFAAGVFTSNEELATNLYNSGQISGDRVWRLPLWDDYKSYMNSDMADIKNLSSVPVAGATTAAKFLEVFTENHPSWAHLDIAGVSFTDNEIYKSRVATGFGIRLLTQWLKTLR